MAAGIFGAAHIKLLFVPDALTCAPTQISALLDRYQSSRSLAVSVIFWYRHGNIMAAAVLIWGIHPRCAR